MKTIFASYKGRTFKLESSAVVVKCSSVHNAIALKFILYLRQFMAKADLKTKENEASVQDFLNGVENEQRRTDAFRLLEIFEKETGMKAKMWGPAIIGFGNLVLKYETGREFDWMRIAFSPRKANLTLYFESETAHDEQFTQRLGKHKISKACLYINRLSDIDEDVLREMIRDSLAKTEKTHGKQE